MTYSQAVSIADDTATNVRESTQATERTGKELFNATKPFAVDDRAKSWSYLISAVLILTCLVTLSVILPWWPARLLTSLTAGMVTVRLFIFYHDFMHGAILKGSTLAKIIMYPYGLLILSPPFAWRKSHNFHHAHVGLVEHSSVGSFPIMTTEMWESATLWEKFKYKVSRNPLVIVFALITVFLINICACPMFENFSKHWDSLIAIALHAALIPALWFLAGPDTMLFGYLIPIWTASAVGSYLFYVQHNMDGLKMIKKEEWTYHKGAIEASSYLKMSPLMEWFTGNIGYHHIHHLNSRIPFYKLPETMAAIPELQKPATGNLRLKSIWRSLQLKLWDEENQSMVSFREVFQSKNAHHH